MAYIRKTVDDRGRIWHTAVHRGQALGEPCLVLGAARRALVAFRKGQDPLGHPTPPTPRTEAQEDNQEVMG